MKKILPFIASIIIAGNLFAQADTIQPPYKKFNTFPPIKLLLPDSSTYYTKDDLPKKDAVMLMLFSPGCSHCRVETDSLLKNIDKFANIRIVMATTMPFEDMVSFIREFKLNEYPNIVVGRDEQFFIPVYFGVSHLPFLAFYDKKKTLISVFEGDMKIDNILAELKK